jgi:aspartate racemase
MTVLGIVGGKGPFSALALYQLIVEKALSAGVAYDLQLLIDHEGKAANPAGTGASVLEEQIHRAALRLVKAGATLLITPVAEWQRLLNRVARELSVPCLSMMEAAGTRVKLLELRTVGLLGGEAVAEDGLYTEVFAAHGAETVIANAPGRRIVDRFLDAVNHGLETSRDLEELFAVIEALRTAGAEQIVLGHAELSLIMAKAGLSRGDIDPLDLLAEATVEVLLQREKSRPEPLFPELERIGSSFFHEASENTGANEAEKSTDGDDCDGSLTELKQEEEPDILYDP